LFKTGSAARLTISELVEVKGGEIIVCRPPEAVPTPAHHGAWSRLLIFTEDWIPANRLAPPDHQLAVPQ
jgi:hypothetical protein